MIITIYGSNNKQKVCVIKSTKEQDLLRDDKITINKLKKENELLNNEFLVNLKIIRKMTKIINHYKDSKAKSTINEFFEEGYSIIPDNNNDNGNLWLDDSNIEGKNLQLLSNIQKQKQKIIYLNHKIKENIDNEKIVKANKKIIDKKTKTTNQKRKKKDTTKIDKLSIFSQLKSMQTLNNFNEDVELEQKIGDINEFNYISNFNFENGDEAEIDNNFEDTDEHADNFKTLEENMENLKLKESQILIECNKKLLIEFDKKIQTSSITPESLKSQSTKSQLTTELAIQAEENNINFHNCWACITLNQNNYKK